MAAPTIPSWQLFGEDRAFPDVLHVERIVERAAGLDWRIAPHRHAHLHQIFLLLDGATDLTVEGEAVRMQLPGLLNIPRGVAHGFRFAAGTDGYVLTLAPQEQPEIFGNGLEIAQGIARPFVCAADGDIAAAFASLSREHAARYPHRQTNLKAMATQIVCAMLRLSQAHRALGPANQADPRVVQFQQCVEARFREHLSVQDYADHLTLSPRHLNRLCQANLGLSAQGVIAAATFREACSLLVYTRMSVATVAYELGFQDPSYFTRAFQRETGQSPTDYRARFEQ